MKTTTHMEPEGRVLEVRGLETNTALTRLAGVAVPYDAPADIGWFTESFARGALDKSIKESARALPLLLFHDDMSFPIGVAEEWKSEADGLHGVWKLDTSETAQRAGQLAQDGLLSFMSIRFAPIRSEWTYAQDFAPDLGAAHKDSVIRVEARLLETSLVSTPAYNKAAVSWVRTGERSMTRNTPKRKLDAWRDYVAKARES